MMNPKDIEEFGRVQFEKLLQLAEPILNAKLSAHGVSSPSELPETLARELFKVAITETAATYAPHLDVAKLFMGLDNFSKPAFAAAHSQTLNSAAPADAFEPAYGEAAAVLMAGFGVKVAPFDLASGEQLHDYSADVDAVQKAFNRKPPPMVAYSSPDAEFYLLATDCLKTLRSKVEHSSFAGPIRALIRRSKAILPPADEPFIHFSCLFGRNPGDRMQTLNLLDDREDRGSVMLLAGWRDKAGEVQGSPRHGLAPILASLVHRAANDPSLAYWLTEPHDSRSPWI